MPLIIPNKQLASGPDLMYRTDMEAIERYINSLKSGSGPFVFGVSNPGSAELDGEGDTAFLAGDVAEGTGTIASGGASHAEGINTRAQGPASHAEGNGSRALAGWDHVEGSFGQSWAPGQSVLGGTPVALGARGVQSSRILMNLQTFDAIAAPTPMKDVSGAANLDFLTAFGTFHIVGYICAIEEESSDTSVWKFECVVQNGSGGLISIGALPAPTLVAQTAGAATWTVALSIGAGTSFIITVKGSNAVHMRWAASLYLDEVA